MSIDPPALQDLLTAGDSLVARALPDESVEVALERGASTTVKVHGAEVESLTSAGSAAVGIRVVREGRVGFASCGTLDPEVLTGTLTEARDNCRFAQRDEHNGLAEPDGVDAVGQDTFSDAVLGMSADERIASALDLERRVLGLDPRVTAARSTSAGDGWGQAALVSTTGIRRASEGTHASAATQPLARSGGETQIGWAVDAARDLNGVDFDRVAADAVQRATKLLGAGRPPTGRMAVVLDPRLAVTLLSIVAQMLSGDAVAKGRSPFADRLGEEIASVGVNLVDDPTRSDSLAAEEFDGEGLACRPNPLVSGGVLQRFLYDSTSARRAGLASTGSAVRSARGLPSPGAQLLVIEPGDTDLHDLVEGVDLGIAVESFSGLHSGVNPTSGDFSVGADGVMIRSGDLAEPVKELTLASTIQRLLFGITAVGSDFEWLPGGDGGVSLCIDDVSVSGGSDR